MKLGAISDIHANRVALEAVLDAMPAVDLVVCAGDIVGYNPWPADCVEIVRERGIVCVQGNHDRDLDSPGRYRANEMAHEGLLYANSQLDEEQIEWIRTLPESRTLADSRVRVVHSHPTHRDRYVRPAMFPELAPHLDSELLILGHTHVQHHTMVGETLVVNPGSVGQPRDTDPRTAYAVIDLDAMRCDERRVEYDIEQVKCAVDRAGLPERTAERLELGK